MKTGQACERSVPVRAPDQLGRFMVTSMTVPCPVSTAVMSLLSVVPRRDPPAAWQTLERGAGRPITAAIIVEHSPLNGRDTRPMRFGAVVRGPALPLVSPIAGLMPTAVHARATKPG
ncbi:MAG: hypothetical protein ACRYG4_09125 [Janthinobacterium lividum]